MFKHILAIDVANRIEDFSSQLKGYGSEASLILGDSDELARVPLSSLASVDALLISIYQELGREHLALLPTLTYIGVLGSSTAKLPLDYCKERNIKVDTVLGYCDYETAEWVIGQIITHFRSMVPTKSVYEKHLGLIGVGGVGAQVLKVALALGMKVSFNSMREHPELIALGAEAATKKEIFAQCDAISLHTPAHFPWLREQDLMPMKFGALIINSSFGKISINDDFEHFLEHRRDIVLRMDSIAAKSYGLESRAIIDTDAAFDTIDSQKRLIKLFFNNIAKASF